ncbi:MAG TPA: AAA family ATPase [Blastocatellia bacterium]|nr:AAA family ATPase [Blastocatellia bacterium]
MNFPFAPHPPDWRLDWDSLSDEFQFVRDMRGCPQDPVYHAEGDVWVHTRMVCESLIENRRWREGPAVDREIVFVASLLHDVAKPLSTREEDGRITSRGHSKRGEIMARELLWRMGAPFPAREQVANLIRFHQIPFFLIDRPDAQRSLFTASQTARIDLLALVAEADARGRICDDQRKLLDNIALFIQYGLEQECLDAPRKFPSDHSRFLYFRKADRDPRYLAFDDTICDVIVMSGMPGAGKDHWITAGAPDWPVISLDALRREMKIAPAENQGPVVARARERAREYLRRKQPFIWNATNISRQTRDHCISLCAAYNARVRIVYVEAGAERLAEQNRAREFSVPPEVINRLLARWEPPDLTEAHRVDLIVQ